MSTDKPNHLTIEMKNRGGIKHLHHTFHFTEKKNIALIYASNGTMKTSFAKAMDVVDDYCTGILGDKGVYIYPRAKDKIPISEFPDKEDIKINGRSYQESTTPYFITFYNSIKSPVTFELTFDPEGNSGEYRLQYEKSVKNFWQNFPRMKKIKYYFDPLQPAKPGETPNLIVNLETSPPTNMEEYQHTGDSTISGNDLMVYLSESELKVWNLHHFYMRIEHFRRHLSDKTIYLIIDDIVDSFDAGNRHAILHYLTTLAHEKISHNSETPRFYLIILTHSFDFYRSTFITLQKKSKVLPYLATKDNNGNITLTSQTFKDENLNIFQELRLKYPPSSNENKIINEKKLLIISMLFMRNILIMTNSKKDDLDRINRFIHFEPESSEQEIHQKSPKLKELAEIYKKTFNGEFTLSHDNTTKTIKTVMDSLVSDILENMDHNEKDIIKNLGDKLILSLAIRMKAEEYCSINNRGSISITAYLKELRTYLVTPDRCLEQLKELHACPEKLNALLASPEQLEELHAYLEQLKKLQTVIEDLAKNETFLDIINKNNLITSTDTTLQTIHTSISSLEYNFTTSNFKNSIDDLNTIITSLRNANLNFVLESTINLLNKILIETPEFIHLNDLMLASLIDIPIATLKDMHDRITALLHKPPIPLTTEGVINS